MTKTKKTQDQRSAQTTARVLRVAEKHFAAHGYEGTSTEALVGEVGLTRGALYHHFGSKRGLFEAVVEAVQERLALAVVGAAEQKEPWEALVAGCRAWLAAATEPAARRILLLDAPSVLGWERWLALDERGGGRLLREGVHACVERGLLETTDPEALVQLLSGAMNGAALWVAASEDGEAALGAATGTLERLLRGLKT